MWHRGGCSFPQRESRGNYAFPLPLNWEVNWPPRRSAHRPHMQESITPMDLAQSTIPSKHPTITRDLKFKSETFLGGFCQPGCKAVGWLLIHPNQGSVCVSLTQINCDLSWSGEAMKAICLCNYLSEGSLLLPGETQHIIIQSAKRRWEVCARQCCV